MMCSLSWFISFLLNLVICSRSFLTHCVQLSAQNRFQEQNDEVPRWLREAIPLWMQLWHTDMVSFCEDILYRSQFCWSFKVECYILVELFVSICQWTWLIPPQHGLVHFKIYSCCAVELFFSIIRIFLLVQAWQTAIYMMAKVWWVVASWTTHFCIELK